MIEMPTTNTATEPDNVVNLKGTSANPARDPKIIAKAGNKGSVGDKALMDAVVVVAVAWVLLVLLAYSLRHHNN